MGRGFELVGGDRYFCANLNFAEFDFYFNPHGCVSFTETLVRYLLEFSHFECFFIFDSFKGAK